MSAQQPDFLNGAIYISALIAFNIIHFSYIRKNKRASIARLSEPFNIAMSLWMLGLACEQFFGLGAANLFWTKLKHTGAIMLGPIWVLIAVAYTRSDALWDRRLYKIIPLIFVPPAVALFGIITENRFHLFYGDAVNGFGNGILFFIIAIYSCFLILSGYIIMAAKMLESRTPARFKIILTLSMIVVVPLIAILIFLMDQNKHFSVVPPLLISMAIISSVYGMRKFEMLRWLPLSMQEIVESLPAGIVVLDRMGQLITVNPAASRMLAMAGSAASVFIDRLADRFGSCPSGRVSPLVIELGDRFFRFEQLETGRCEAAVEGVILSVTDITSEHKLKHVQKRILETIDTEIRPRIEAALESMGETGPAAKKPEAFDELIVARRRLERLSAQLNLMSEIDNAQQSSIVETTDIVPVIKSCIQRFEGRLGATDCPVVSQLPDSIDCRTDSTLFAVLIESMLSGISNPGNAERVSLKAYVNEDGAVVDATGRFSHVDLFGPASGRLATTVPDSLDIALCKAVSTLLDVKFNVDVTDADTIRLTATLPK